MHAFAPYLSADVANIAVACEVELTYLSSAVEGYVDRRAIPCPSDGFRRIGHQGVKVTFDIRGYADHEALPELVEQSRRSAAKPIAVSVKRGNGLTSGLEPEKGQP